MSKETVNKTLNIGDMTCVSCANKIEQTLKEIEGVITIKVSYTTGKATITFDPEIINLSKIEKIIEELDYRVISGTKMSKPKRNTTNIIGIAILILSMYMLLKNTGVLNVFNVFPQAKAGMDYGMLFVVGLLTSIHCVAMCGGVNLSQCLITTENTESKSNSSSIKPSFFYNLGRVISYTFIGAIIGSLGQVVSFSGAARGIVQLIAGVFMVIMGLNILNMFPGLRKFNPRMPKVFAKKITKEKRKSTSPFYIGLLNGLMPCGPLQAMQLYALSTGDPIKGALSMLLFSLGTVPLMFGLGALSSILSKKFTSKMMTVSAVTVILMGIFMFNNGMSLSGLSLPFMSANDENAKTTQVEDGLQTVTTNLSSGGYEPITVQVGIPVKWVVNAKDGTINGCNNKIIVDEYDIQKELEVGENVIEFTPMETGTYTYSCWMGMINSEITVIDDDEKNTSQKKSSDVDKSKKEKDTLDSKYTIPTDEVVISKVGEYVQTVSTTMDTERFTPSIIIVQAGYSTELTVTTENNDVGTSKLLISLFNTVYDLTSKDNVVSFYPTEDFTISTNDYSKFAYIKVVDDINNVDIEAIKQEVNNYKPTTWDYSNAVNASNAPSCH